MSDDINDGMKAWQDATNERLRTWPPAPAAPVLDPTNHHNALKCPYCNPKGLTFAEPAAPVPASVREALTDIDSWRYDTLGQRPRDESEETEVNAAFDRGARMAFYRCSDRARAALASLPAPEAAPTREEIADMRPTYVSELARSLASDAFDDLADEHPEAKTYTLARWFDAIRSLKGARGKVQELAVEFDCSDHIIWKIMNRKTWAHVPEVSLAS